MQAHANARHWSAGVQQMVKDYIGPTAFENLLTELSKLHIKYLQQLLTDLNKGGAIRPFYGDYHRMMVNTIENVIMERQYSNERHY